MFTGLIQEKSKVISATPQNGGLKITLNRPEGFVDLKLGESIAIDGACLTLVGMSEFDMTFFVGGETLIKTTLGDLQVNAEVNLERSLVVGDRLGGHIVTGHVDGTAKVVKRAMQGDCLAFQIKVTGEQFRWIVPKGSLCLNGVSLTVNMISRNDLSVDVLLIPETLTRTNLKNLQVGDRVNVECDQTVKIIARQVEMYGVNIEQHF